MTEQVWRCQHTETHSIVWLPYKPVGPYDCVPFIRKSDHDALHQQVEGLRADYDEAADDAMAAAREASSLRAELEAARGGIAEAVKLIDCVSRHPNSRIPVIDQARRVLIKLTVTPVPEVRQQEQGERQEAQVMGRVHHNPNHAEPVRAVLNSIGRQLPDNAPLYAEPQPAQDVSALVEALETCLEIEERPAVIQRARAALATYRKETKS